MLFAPPPDARICFTAHALLLDDRQAVAERIGDAFHDRADHVAARVLERQADERAAGVRVGVRRAFAGEVGQEEQALRRRAA